MNGALRILEMLGQGTITVMAANLLQSVKHDLGKPGTGPIVGDIDDADERVQISIG